MVSQCPYAIAYQGFFTVCLYRHQWRVRSRPACVPRLNWPKVALFEDTMSVTCVIDGDNIGLWLVQFSP